MIKLPFCSQSREAGTPGHPSENWQLSEDRGCGTLISGPSSLRPLHFPRKQPLFLLVPGSPASPSNILPPVPRFLTLPLSSSKERKIILRGRHTKLQFFF